MNSLSEGYPPKLLLAIYQRWNKEGHGVTLEEEDYIPYFKTKNLVLRDGWAKCPTVVVFKQYLLHTLLLFHST